MHLLKTAAGLSSVEDLAARQAANRFTRDGEALTYAYTRYRPTRGKEILRAGGSLYWILKHKITVRQKIVAFDIVEPEGEKSWCKIVVEPALIRTILTPRKAIQGWRYLDPAKAPRDRAPGLSDQDQEDFPADLEADLRAAGLL